MSSSGLTLDILINVQNLVDVAISRGAYKPNEVSAVGKIYDQYIAGLKLIRDQAADAAAAAADASTDASTADDADADADAAAAADAEETKTV
jgi:hypothetical protein